LILRKIIKIVAKRRQILSPKCTKLDVGWGPRPRWVSLQRSPEPLAGLKGPTSKGKGRGGVRGGVREGDRERGEGGEEREGKGRTPERKNLATGLKETKTIGQ